MTIGAETLYSDISGYVNTILEGSEITLAQANVLVATIKTFNDTVGMNPRALYKWGVATPRDVAEGEDVVAENFTKSAVATLTPARSADMFFLSEERINTDWDNVKGEASDALGFGFAAKVDKEIAVLFKSLTGGTVGTAGGTPNWSQIRAAQAILWQAGVMGPYTCALGVGQFYHLQNAGGTAVSSTFMRSEAFMDKGYAAASYWETSLLPGIVFAITNNVSGAGGGTAYGAMYVPSAMAYDERLGYRLRYQEDQSKNGWELNADLHYGKGVLNATRGVQIISTDVIPTT